MGCQIAQRLHPAVSRQSQKEAKQRRSEFLRQKVLRTEVEICKAPDDDLKRVSDAGLKHPQ